MGLLRLMAVRAFRKCRCGEMIVRAPGVLSPFRVAPFWIGHADSSVRSRDIGGNSMAFSGLWLLLFEPVLLQPRQWCKPRIAPVAFAPAVVAIQVGAAMRA